MTNSPSDDTPGGNPDSAPKGAVLNNVHTLALFGLVIATVTSSQHLFSKVPAFTNPNNPTALMAVLAGTIVAFLVYIPVKFLYGGVNNKLTNNHMMSISVLMGLVSSVFMVFGVEPGMPPISSLALMVFLFYSSFDRHIL